ncbi:MAG: TIGR00304 family membrane protein [Candidatus Thorarchaeota archaeon]|jgi:uncharacterized protein (TIGR00304 family)
MIIQIIPLIDLIAYGLVLTGIIIVLVGIWLMSRSSEKQSDDIKRESKAIIFIGPIPLVWGYSRRTQGILFIIALTLFLSWILWFYWLN